MTSKVKGITEDDPTAWQGIMNLEKLTGVDNRRIRDHVLDAQKNPNTSWRFERRLAEPDDRKLPSISANSKYVWRAIPRKSSSSSVADSDHASYPRLDEAADDAVKRIVDTWFRRWSELRLGMDKDKLKVALADILKEEGLVSAKAAEELLKEASANTAPDGNATTRTNALKWPTLRDSWNTAHDLTAQITSQKKTIEELKSSEKHLKLALKQAGKDLERLKTSPHSESGNGAFIQQEYINQLADILFDEPPQNPDEIAQEALRMLNTIGKVSRNALRDSQVSSNTEDKVANRMLAQIIYAAYVESEKVPVGVETAIAKAAASQLEGMEKGDEG